VEFSLFEDRAAAVLVIIARNVVNKAEIFRSIFLDLPRLYFEMEAKAQGNRQPLTKKKDKKLGDEALSKVVAEFVLARLNIKADPLPWPIFSNSPDSDKSDVNSSTVENVGEQSEAIIHLERMCTFDKMSADTVEFEIAPPSCYCRVKASLVEAGFPEELLEGLRALPPVPAGVTMPNTVVEETNDTIDQPVVSEVSTCTTSTETTTSPAKGSKGEVSTGKKTSATVVPAQAAAEKGKVTKPSAPAGKSKGGLRSKKVAPS
jgi:hypothetical protein